MSIEDVKEFHNKFGVPQPDKPHFLNEEAFSFRMKFMNEELKEFHDAHLDGDMHGAADALVDLVYVVYGTALMMGIPWQSLWNEVQRANMAKRRAQSAEESKRGSSLDVIKPPGWTPPDHTPFLGIGPFPVTPSHK